MAGKNKHTHASVPGKKRSTPPNNQTVIKNKQSSADPFNLEKQAELVGFGGLGGLCGLGGIPGGWFPFNVEAFVIWILIIVGVSFFVGFSGFLF